MKIDYKDSYLVPKKEFLDIANSLSEYIDRLNLVAKTERYIYDESSINVPFDNLIFDTTMSMIKKYKSKELKYILVVGIGGSNLGAKAIYDALRGYFDILNPSEFPKIIFLDTNDFNFLSDLKRFLAKIKNSNELLINVITKSGSTTETLANLEILTFRKPKLRKRLVITTDYNSPLWKIGEELGLDLLPIPQIVGGRFSVFTSVGLFPLGMAGFNLLSLLKGAMKARNYCLSKNIDNNLALISAVTAFYHYRNVIVIHDSFYFHPELESLGKWYRQLVAESLGKDGVGITPTVSVGSTDLHSMGQLYLGGPLDKYFNFIWANSRGELKVPISFFTQDIAPFIQGKSTTQIMESILKGVKIAYMKHGIPFIHIEFNGITEESLGEYMQFKMIETMYLGKLLGVNAFNQPNVESYKKETKKILQSYD